MLGYLDPASFLGGRMHLDVAAAREAIERRIADPLGVSVEEAAFGIHDLVNESMTNAARVHAVERGKDPSSMPLFAFGGAGPVHACGVAQALGVPSLVGPPAAGVLSAIGFLTAPLAFDFVRSVRARIEDLTLGDVDARFAEMEAEGLSLLAASGVPEATISHRRFADLRHEGQGYEIRVPVTASAGDFPDVDPARVRRGVPRAVRAPRPARAGRGRQLAGRLDRPATRVRALARARGGAGEHAQGPPPRLVPARPAGTSRPTCTTATRWPPALPVARARDRRGARVDASSSRRARAAPSRPTAASSWSSPDDAH